MNDRKGGSVPTKRRQFSHLPFEVQMLQRVPV